MTCPLNAHLSHCHRCHHFLIDTEIFFGNRIKGVSAQSLDLTMVKEYFPFPQINSALWLIFSSATAVLTRSYCILSVPIKWLLLKHKLFFCRFFYCRLQTKQLRRQHALFNMGLHLIKHWPTSCLGSLSFCNWVLLSWEVSLSLLNETNWWQISFKSLCVDGVA